MYLLVSNMPRVTNISCSCVLKRRKACYGSEPRKANAQKRVRLLYNPSHYRPASWGASNEKRHSGIGANL